MDKVIKALSHWEIIFLFQQKVKYSRCVIKQNYIRKGKKQKGKRNRYEMKFYKIVIYSEWPCPAFGLYGIK